jgi:hypothetical protein
MTRAQLAAVVPCTFIISVAAPVFAQLPGGSSTTPPAQASAPVARAITLDDALKLPMMARRAPPGWRRAPFCCRA